jgi:hypothetical protein
LIEPVARLFRGEDLSGDAKETKMSTAPVVICAFRLER